MNDSLDVIDVFPESKEKRTATKVLRNFDNFIKKSQSNEDQIQTLETKIHEANDDAELQHILTSYSSEKSVQKYNFFLAEISEFISKITGKLWIKAKVNDNKFEDKVQKIIHEFEQCQIAVKEVRFY